MGAVNGLCVCDAYGMCPAGCPHCEVCSGDEELRVTGDIAAFITARLDEDEAAARAASGGTVTGGPGNWEPAPGGDEWEVHADLTDGDFGLDGDLEVLVALRPGLPRPPDVMAGYWGAVIGWQPGLADRDAWVPEPQFRHMARHDPARVLREVAAKRAIVALAAKTREWTDGSAGATAGYAAVIVSDTLYALATVWSDHPDYRAEWGTAGVLSP